MRVIAFLIVLALSSAAGAQDYVNGYWRHNSYYGPPTYVQGYYRSAPDGNFWNNYSTYPNINPYTGSLGTHRYPPIGYGFQAPIIPTYTAPMPSTHLHRQQHSGGIRVQW